MPEDNLQSYFVVEDLRRKVDTLRNLLSKVRSQEYFRPSPRRLCDLLQTVCNAVKDWLPYLTKLPPEEQEREARAAWDVLNATVICTGLAERATVLNTPWSLLESLEDLFRRVLERDVYVVITPEWEYNYSTSEDVFAYYKDVLEAYRPPAKLKEELQPFELGILIVCFPRPERLNALLHACFAHEVGHLLGDPWLAENFDQRWASLGADVAQVVWKEVQAVYGSRPVEKQIEIALSGVSEAKAMARRGLSELAADFVGISLFSFGALFAFFESALRFEADMEPRLENGYYPPWRYRLRRCLRYLEGERQAVAGGGLEGALELQKPLGNWVEVVSQYAKRRAEEPESAPQGDQPVFSSAAATAAYDAIEKELWDPLQSHLQSSIGSHEYDFTGEWPTIGELADRLDHHLIPNETGEYPATSAVDFRTIINAGWVYKLRVLSECRQRHQTAGEKEEQEERLDYLSEIEVANKLILKAVEASRIREQYSRGTAAWQR